MDHPEFMTLKEAAEELRLSVPTLKRYIYSGKLASYRTPGGGHRLRRADLAALLGAGPSAAGEESAALAPLRDAVHPERDRAGRALQLRLGRIESEVERLGCSLDAITAALRRAVASRQQPHPGPRASAALEIKILGPGCRACDQLADLVVEIAHAVGLSDESISRVREIEEIAEYGPTPMPALLVNNQLVTAGRLPTKSRLTQLLQQYRSDQSHSENH